MKRFLDDENNIITECETVDEFINEYYVNEAEFLNLKASDDLYKEIYETVKENPKYQLLHAEFYAYGKVVEENNIKFFDMLKELVDKKDKRATCYLGVAYFNGDGIDKDEKLGIKLITKAADLGYSLADYELCIYYANHYAISKLAKCKAKLKEKGTPRAKYNLAMSFSEVGSYLDAFPYMLSAAKAGFDEAMYYVALMYKDGKGTKKSQKDYEMWMNKAKKLGNPRALLETE
ncbi:MAG: sel1 repeat family protein [Acholeplasmatales bacterium]|nr:sel1 repeat family protein [Acholeplasmatales bacterium]